MARRACGMTLSDPSAQPVLECRALSKSFKGFYAVRDVSVAIADKSVHAVIGPNGAGKTTFFNLLTKFLTPSSGAIFYEGRDITRESPWSIPNMGIIRSFQISAVFPDLTVLENVRVSYQRSQGYDYQFWVSNRKLDDFDDRCMAFLKQVGLERDAMLHAGSLPYGRKRALEIATTLALSPRVMLLDEPTAGMGHESIGLVTELIQEARRDRTIVLVEHNLDVVKDLSDRITVMQRGQVLVEGSYDAVSNDPRVIEAYIGGDLMEDVGRV